jgi:UDP-2,3-diacylglucosamine pyrophosphatase LpxH
MGFFGFFKDLVINGTVHVFQDIFMPGSRTSRRIEQDIKKGKTIPVDFDKDKFIIFSDIHRGDGKKNDRFKNVNIYSDALSHYKEDYNLVLLGDIEECWGYKKKMDNLIHHNKDLFAQESHFITKGRYIRIIGNHDDMWARPEKVDKYLNPYTGGKDIEPCPAVILEQNGKKLLLIHGCQGNNFSDIGDQFSSSMVNFKFNTGVVKSSLKEFEKKRRKLRKQELRILKWAKGKKMIVVMGHTHTPYFLSQPTTRFETKVLSDIDTALRKVIDKQTRKQLEKSKRSLNKIISSVEELRKEIDKVKVEISPAVFNSGNCCKDIDEISAIEISDGEIREVYWKAGENQPQIVNKEKLSKIFQML